MKTVIHRWETLAPILDPKYNPPIIRNQKDENCFQAEVKEIYNRLLECLSPLGEQGDYINFKDFIVHPDLRERPRVVRLAPHLREFIITVHSQEFLQSDYLPVLHRFLVDEVPEYRIVTDYETDFSVTQMVILMPDSAAVLCDDLKDQARLVSVLSKL